VQVHAAVALAATQNRERASSLLERAIALEPSLAQRDDVRQLRTTLQAPGSR